MSPVLYSACRLMLIGALVAFGCSAAMLGVWAAPWSFIVGFVGVAAAVKKRGRKLFTAYGTARWAEEEDLERAGMLDAGDGLILGRTGYRRPSLIAAIKSLLSPTVAAPEACRRFLAALSSPGSVWARPSLVRLPRSAVHSAIFAPPGAGKSTGIAIPFLLTSSQSCVVVDFKGELALATAEHRHRFFGHDIIILDPFKVVSQ
jgi:type IV secretion system protein VirD4